MKRTRSGRGFFAAFSTLMLIVSLAGCGSGETSSEQETTVSSGDITADDNAQEENTSEETLTIALERDRKSVV